VPLLLLGAGASFGSETDTKIVPPLASNLFDALLEFAPDVIGDTSEGLRKIFRQDFEKGVLALAEASPGLLAPMQRVMGAFFFRYGPSSNSLYVRLAHEIKASAWNGAIATLNYERLVLLALAHGGVPCSCNTPSQDSGTEICLPHGCCNLFCESVQGLASAVAMAGMNVQTNGPVVSVDHPDIFWNRIRTDAFPPVMSYFEPGKYTLSGANFIQDQRKRLVELIESATAIAVVGIAVRTQDAHLWDSLAKTEAKILYCAGSAAAKTYDSWRGSTTKRSHDLTLNGFWREHFDTINGHLGIK